jgi:hypothetical protein
MQKMCVGVPLAAVLLFFASCEWRSSTSPTPTVTSVTISSSSDMLKINETVAFAATAAHSDGTNEPVTDWRSDAPAVATVDAATGRVTGVGAGLATIVATHDGMNATKLVRVVPDFSGTWIGRFEVTGCSASGDFAPHQGCLDGTYPVGYAGDLRFEDFRQDRDNVVGYLEYPVDTGFRPTLATAVVRGTITTGGHLPLTGALSDSGGSWSLTLSADGTDLYIDSARMRGSFTLDLTRPSRQGSLTLRHAITGGGLTKLGTTGSGSNSGGSNSGGSGL